MGPEMENVQGSKRTEKDEKAKEIGLWEANTAFAALHRGINLTKREKEAP